MRREFVVGSLDLARIAAAEARAAVAGHEQAEARLEARRAQALVEDERSANRAQASFPPSLSPSVHSSFLLLSLHKFTQLLTHIHTLTHTHTITFSEI